MSLQQKRKQRWSARAKPVLLLALATPILAGCARMTASGGIDAAAVACRSFAPISWSSRDTDQTIREIKEHNAVGKELCAWTR